MPARRRDRFVPRGLLTILVSIGLCLGLGVGFSLARLTGSQSVSGNTLTTGTWGIRFVKNIATNTRSGGGNSSITLTVPAAGVAAGHSVIFAFQAGSNAGTMSCADSKSNAYSTDYSSASGTARVAVASAHNIVALVSGNTITCSYPSFSGSAEATANEFSGLTSTPQDKTAFGASSNAGAATSGPTATTSQANELVFGYFNLGNTSQTFTPNASYTVVGNFSKSNPMYKIVTATGQYEANGTVSGSGGWKAICVTYKGA